MGAQPLRVIKFKEITELYSNSRRTQLMLQKIQMAPPTVRKTMLAKFPFKNFPVALLLSVL
jgi:hypothetical protein